MRKVGPGGSALAYFASELRYQRTKASMSQPEVGRWCYCSGTLIRMFEGAKRVPRPEHLKGMDAAFGVDMFERMWEYINRESHPTYFRPFDEYEQEATRLREFHPLAVPGLLQTEDYARALMRSGRPDYSEDQIEEFVAARMERQRAILDKDDPPMLVVLLHEPVLSCPVGGREVMRDQLDALLKVAQRPRVIVQIVPLSTGAGAGLAGMFSIATLNDNGGDVLYIESATSGQVIDRADEVASCAVAYEALHAAALPREASLELIRQRKEDYEP